MSHVCSLVSKYLYMILTCFIGFVMLNLCLDDLILIIWGQWLICHHECLAPMLYLVVGHKLFFVANTFHVPNMNLKMKCKLLEKCAPMSYVLNFNCFWVLYRCMMPTNEKSHT
jgi:hypothetical protein